MINQQSLRHCIESCWSCRTACQTTLFHHCLEQGGEHTTPVHVRLMTDCMDICQTAADFMTRHSLTHAAVCSACAETCEACAKSCDAIGGPDMEQCAQACRLCATACREMSHTQRKAA